MSATFTMLTTAGATFATPDAAPVVRVAGSAPVIAPASIANVAERVLIVLLTATNGPWLVVSGGAFLFGLLAAPPRGLALDPMLDLREPASAILLVLTMLLAAVGAVVQLRDASPMFGRRA